MANNININPNILNENVDKVVLRPAQLIGKRLREVSENMECHNIYIKFVWIK